MKDFEEINIGYGHTTDDKIRYILAQANIRSEEWARKEINKLILSEYKDSRHDVIAEIEEWVNKNSYNEERHYPTVIDAEELLSKLEEMKGKEEWGHITEGVGKDT